MLNSIIMTAEVKDGHLGYLTEEQEAKLCLFKIEIVTHNIKDWRYDISKFDNYELLRFLQARKFNVDKAFEMFDKYVKWRITEEIDKINVIPFI